MELIVIWIRVELCLNNGFILKRYWEIFKIKYLKLAFKLSKISRCLALIEYNRSYIGVCCAVCKKGFTKENCR